MDGFPTSLKKFERTESLNSRRRQILSSTVRMQIPQKPFLNVIISLWHPSTYTSRKAEEVELKVLIVFNNLSLANHDLFSAISKVV